MSATYLCKGFLFTTKGSTSRWLILQDCLTSAKLQLIDSVACPESWYYIGEVNKCQGVFFDTGTAYDPDLHGGKCVTKIKTT